MTGRRLLRWRQTDCSTGGDKSEAGYALVSAIWFIGFLATAAVLLSTTTRYSIQSTRFALESAKARAYADGLVDLIGLAIASENRDRAADRKILRDGTVIDCTLPDGWVAEVKVQDQRGLLNVNLATRSTLTKYLELTLPGQSNTTELADGILAFREAGNAAIQPAPDQSTQAGLRNAGRFRSLDELDQIAGMTPELRSRIVRFLTVHGKSTRIDINLAPAGFRDAAQKISPGQSPSVTSIMELSIVVRHAKGVTAGRSAMLDILPHPRRPFSIVGWSDWSQTATDVTSPAQPTARKTVTGCEKMFAAR